MVPAYSNSTRTDTETTSNTVGNSTFVETTTDNLNTTETGNATTGDYTLTHAEGRELCSRLKRPMQQNDLIWLEAFIWHRQADDAVCVRGHRNPVQMPIGTQRLGISISD